MVFGFLDEEDVVVDAEVEGRSCADNEEKRHGGRIVLFWIAASRGISVLRYKANVRSIFCFPARASFIKGIILIT